MTISSTSREKTSRIGALDEVGFLVDQRRRGGGQRALADVVPEAQQVLAVLLDLGLRPLRAGGADDQAHPVGQAELVDRLPQALAVGGRGDLAGDAAAARRVRHQHGEAAGERDVGGQRRALGAALLLDDLHQHDLPALDDFLDLVVAQEARRDAALLAAIVAFLGALAADGLGRGLVVALVARGAPGLLVVVAARLAPAAVVAPATASPVAPARLAGLALGGTRRRIAAGGGGLGLRLDQLGRTGAALERLGGRGIEACLALGAVARGLGLAVDRAADRPGGRLRRSVECRRGFLGGEGLHGLGRVCAGLGLGGGRGLDGRRGLCVRWRGGGSFRRDLAGHRPGEGDRFAIRLGRGDCRASLGGVGSDCRGGLGVVGGNRLAGLGLVGGDGLACLVVEGSDRLGGLLVVRIVMGAAGDLLVGGAVHGRFGDRVLVRLLGLAGFLGLHLQQALPVGDRDLVVVGMDLAEGEEAVAVAAVFHEGGLEARLYPHHLGEVDVALQRLAGGCLEVELLEPVAIQHHHAGFFRVGCVDQHALGHDGMHSAPRRAWGAGDGTGWNRPKSDGLRGAARSMRRRRSVLSRRGDATGRPRRESAGPDRGVAPGSVPPMRGGAHVARAKARAGSVRTRMTLQCEPPV